MSSSWQHFFIGSLQVACSATATSDKIKSVVFLTMDKLFFLPHSTSETHLLRNYHRIKVSCTVYIIAIPVVEFSREGYKIRKVLAKNQLQSNELIEIGVMRRCQKVPKFDFQSKFSMSKIILIFLIFFFIEEYEFRNTFLLLTFFDNINF